MACLTQLMDDAENTNMVVFIIIIIHLLFGIKKFNFQQLQHRKYGYSQLPSWHHIPHHSIREEKEERKEGGRKEKGKRKKERKGGKKGVFFC